VLSINGVVRSEATCVQPLPASAAGRQLNANRWAAELMARYVFAAGIGTAAVVALFWLLSFMIERRPPEAVAFRTVGAVHLTETPQLHPRERSDSRRPDIEAHSTGLQSTSGNADQDALRVLAELICKGTSDGSMCGPVCVPSTYCVPVDGEGPLTLAMIFECQPDMPRILAALQASLELSTEIDRGPPPNKALQLPVLHPPSTGW
jgi:hypothetical protein